MTAEITRVKVTRPAFFEICRKCGKSAFDVVFCEPCVEELPKLKAAYEMYKGQGVEFIGVSLDLPEPRGGLNALRKFIAENKVPWPQYYQGNSWQGEFSRTWGINAIPCAFIIDRDGNLLSTNAQGFVGEALKAILTPSTRPAGG